MTVLGSLVIAGGTVLWLVPFLIAKRGAGSVTAVDRRARWGLLIQVVGYAMMLFGGFWTVDHLSWRILAGACFFALAALLSWTATQALGRQLRFDAAIHVEHKLVRTGPYRVIRHPIYGSMLCLLWGIGLVTAPVWLFLAATAVFLVGTEIRVRIEDGLLKRRFGNEFDRFRRSVPAYLPPVR
jgi:protein-S-isoprenylcysteine O-methyltransferase Ste14